MNCARATATERAMRSSSQDDGDVDRWDWGGERSEDTPQTKPFERSENMAFS